MRRILSVVALCALPVSVLTVGFATTASAATNVSCSKLSGNISGTTGKLTKCSDTANTGGSATFPISSLTSGSGTITWHGTGTTAVTVSATPNGGTACAAGDTEYAVTGTTGASTGAAKKSIKKKSTIGALVCLSSTGAFTLVPKTDFTIT